MHTLLQGHVEAVQSNAAVVGITVVLRHRHFSQIRPSIVRHVPIAVIYDHSRGWPVAYHHEVDGTGGRALAQAWQADGSNRKPAIRLVIIHTDSSRIGVPLASRRHSRPASGS